MRRNGLDSRALRHMSERPKTRGKFTPRDRSPSSSGSRRARDDEERRDSDHDSDKSDDHVTDLVKTKVELGGGLGEKWIFCRTGGRYSPLR